MKEIETNLIEILQKATELTQKALKQVQNKDFDELNKTLNNRERALNIAESFSENLSLYKNNPDYTPNESLNNQVTQLISNITSLDDIISSCLEYEKNKTKNEIAKTFKNKENFKGYNLNKIK